MTVAITPTHSLEEFLKLPETKPASEYIRGTHSTSATSDRKADRSILVFQAGQQPELLLGSDRLSVLENIDLDLTVDGIFGWLKMSGN